MRPTGCNQRGRCQPAWIELFSLSTGKEIQTVKEPYGNPVFARGGANGSWVSWKASPSARMAGRACPNAAGSRSLRCSGRLMRMARLFADVLSNALEPGWVPTKMGGPGAPGDLDAAPKTQCGSQRATTRHEQERQQGRAQAIEGRTDLTVELAADPKQPALDQARESEQDADTGNRGPFAKEWCGIIEQPQMGELSRSFQHPTFGGSLKPYSTKSSNLRGLSTSFTSLSISGILPTKVCNRR
jgi:hypothetical protein